LKATIKKIVSEDNFLSLAGNLSISFFGFAGFALLARSFPVDQFGEYVLFISSGTFIEMFRFGITNTAVVRYLSGSSENDRLKYIGSNGLIGLIATVFIAVVLMVSYQLFTAPIQKAGYELFFKWYPLLAFLTLPFNTALVIMQADQEFGKILLVRLINSVSFFLVLAFHFFILRMSLIQLIFAMLAINAVTSLVCMVMRWDGLRHIPKATRETTGSLLDFGKYTTFTLIGTNLLRTADTLIISISPLGPAAVALYSVPLKLTELQMIPLRSFAATAFPKMSRASIQGKTEELKNIFYNYSGAMTYLFILISLGTFFLADLFVLVLGGHQYIGTDPVTGINTANIVRVFSVYGLLLPLDRMTGVGLDSINKPDKNLIKVAFMVAANVIGDLVAVFIFRSLMAVAVASVIFTFVGVLIGFRFLDREMHIDHKTIFISGIDFYRESYEKLKRNLFRTGSSGNI
jgi:O-antigen/teichoic acid export membrane protein